MSVSNVAEARRVPRMNGQVQRICVWSAPAGFVFILAGLLSASWLPFPSPTQTAAQVGLFYLDHASGARLASALLMAGAALLAPMAAVLAVHIRRVEGEFSPLAYLQVGMGCASSLAVSITAMFWWTAAFRPKQDPEITQSWHDAGWLCFTATVFIAIIQLATVVLASFTDTHERPVFPRWSGYLSLWVIILALPSVGCLWFKTGPLAWNGALSLYLAFAAFGTWFISMMAVLLKAIAEQEAELKSSHSPA